MNAMRPHLSLILALSLLGLLAGEARGQARGSLGVGYMNRPGHNPSFGVGTFQRYSYGLGATGRRGGGGGGVLSQSLSAGSYTISRGRASAAASPMGGSLRGVLGGGPAGSQVIYQPQGPNLAVDVGGGGSSLGGLGEGALSGPTNTLGDPETVSRLSAVERAMGSVVVEAFGLAAEDVEPAGPLTSLAPTEGGGLYGQFLREGDARFRQRDYLEAEHQFQMSLDIARKAPESLLSLAHASFALNQYPLSAYYLRRAAEVFPELALAPVALRSFFADDAEFDTVLGYLRAHLEANPDDAAGLFTLGYVLWFDGQTAAAADALRRAAQINAEPLLREGLEAFWAGCLASGQVEGALPAGRD